MHGRGDSGDLCQCGPTACASPERRPLRIGFEPTLGVRHPCDSGAVFEVPGVGAVRQPPDGGGTTRAEDVDIKRCRSQRPRRTGPSRHPGRIRCPQPPAPHPPPRTCAGPAPRWAALTVAVGLVVAVGFSQASSTRSQASPVAGVCAGRSRPRLEHRGRHGPGAHHPAARTAARSATRASRTRRPAGPGAHHQRLDRLSLPAAGKGQELIVNGSTGGSLRYTGIPYPAAGSNRAGVVNGTRLAQ